MSFTETVTIKQLVDFLMLLFSSYILLQTVLQRNINKNSNRFVLYLMVAFTVICLLSVISGVNGNFSKFFVFLYIPSFIFIPPTTFLYIKSLTTKHYVFTKKDKRHYIVPFIVLVIMFVFNMLLLFSQYSWGGKVTNMLVDIYLYMNIVILLLIPVVQLFIYGYLIVRQYRSHLKEIENYFSNTDEAKMWWIRWFIAVFILFMIIFNIVNFNYANNLVITDVFYYAEVFMFIGFLGLFGIKQADIYRLVSNTPHDLPDNNNFGTSNSTGILPGVSVNQDNAAQIPESMPFALGTEKKDQIRLQLLDVMENHKPYLNPTLTITELADQIETNQKYLSVVINDCFNKNFFAFINEYRVNEAIKLLNTPVGQQYSIEGVGKTVGFNSRSTFISAFKKQTKTTPSEYKNN